MKLLKKQEVDRLKAEERRQQIEEGLKVARQVDTLREVRAAEEESLQKFRRETVGSISKEITELTLKRDALKVEVAVLEGKRVVALKPLKDKEGKLALSEYTLVELHEMMYFKRVALDEAEAELAARKKLLEDLEVRTTYAHSDVQRRLDEVAIMEESAALQKEKVREMSARTLEEKKNQEEHFYILEKKWKEKNHVLEARESDLLEKDQDLSNRERALQDKYETFIRVTTKYGKPK